MGLLSYLSKWPLKLKFFSHYSISPLQTKEEPTIVDSSETFESVVPDLVPETPQNEEVRVYVRCNYCDSFRSTLNGETWEAILNHILPVAKEEIQTTFYGDLEKHFYRSVRIQVNGRQMVRTRSPSGTTGELYERFVRKRALVKYQSQSEVIKV